MRNWLADIVSIEDGKRDKPRYRGLFHGTKSLVKERGLGGIYRGLFAVTIRQSANSAVRMGSYNWMKGSYADHMIKRHH